MGKIFGLLSEVVNDYYKNFYEIILVLLLLILYYFIVSPSKAPQTSLRLIDS